MPEESRSTKWPALRDAFLKGKKCAVCGGVNKLVAHHIKPFHLFPKLELEPSNLIALCEDGKNVSCHITFGHFMDFEIGYNLDVVSDAIELNRKFRTHRE